MERILHVKTYYLIEVTRVKKVQITSEMWNMTDDSEGRVVCDVPVRGLTSDMRVKLSYPKPVSISSHEVRDGYVRLYADCIQDDFTMSRIRCYKVVTE